MCVSYQSAAALIKICISHLSLKWHISVLHVQKEKITAHYKQQREINWIYFSAIWWGSSNDKKSIFSAEYTERLSNLSLVDTSSYHIMWESPVSLRLEGSVGSLLSKDISHNLQTFWERSEYLNPSFTQNTTEAKLNSDWVMALHTYHTLTNSPLSLQSFKTLHGARQFVFLPYLSEKRKNQTL